MDKRNNQAKTFTIVDLKIRASQKDDLAVTFPYLLETKIPYKEAVIPFLGFPAFNRKKKKRGKKG